MRTNESAAAGHVTPCSPLIGRYDTAVTRDLWAALTKASTKGLDVAAMMDTWTLQVNIGRMVRILGCH